MNLGRVDRAFRVVLSVGLAIAGILVNGHPNVGRGLGVAGVLVFLAMDAALGWCIACSDGVRKGGVTMSPDVFVGFPIQRRLRMIVERSLHVIDKRPDAPLTAVCTACNRRFIARHEPGEDPVHRLTREFNRAQLQRGHQPSPCPDRERSYQGSLNR